MKAIKVLVLMMVAAFCVGCPKPFPETLDATSVLLPGGEIQVTVAGGQFFPEGSRVSFVFEGHVLRGFHGELDFRAGPAPIVLYDVPRLDGLVVVTISTYVEPDEYERTSSDEKFLFHEKVKTYSLNTLFPEQAIVLNLTSDIQYQENGDRWNLVVPGSGFGPAGLQVRFSAPFPNGNVETGFLGLSSSYTIHNVPSSAEYLEIEGRLLDYVGRDIGRIVRIPLAFPGGNNGGGNGGHGGDGDSYCLLDFKVSKGLDKGKWAFGVFQCTKNGVVDVDGDGSIDQDDLFTDLNPEYREEIGFTYLFVNGNEYDYTLVAYAEQYTAFGDEEYLLWEDSSVPNNWDLLFVEAWIPGGKQVLYRSQVLPLSF